MPAITYVERERADFWQLYKEPGTSGYLDPLGPKNCQTHSAARSAMRSLEGARPAGIVGQWPPNGYDIRRHCFEPNGSRDITGGTNHSQVQRAVRMLYGVSLDVHNGDAFDDFVDALEETHGGQVSLRYRRVRDYVPRRGSLTFADNHEIFVGGVDRARGVFTDVVDPLANGGDYGRPAGLYHGPGDYPISLIKSAAGELNVSSTSTYRPLGFGKAYFLLTPKTGLPPSAPRLYRVVITGKTLLYAVPNGERVGAVSRATYTCTRSKVGGIWWYRIVGPSRSGNLGRWFKPNGNVEAHYA